MVAVPLTPHVVVIGGGFAGLSAGSKLAQAGWRVTIVEGRQVLGGRAYSFTDPKTRDSVDNGQHLFMGCYRQTQEFLKRIGTLDMLVFQQNLSINFAGDQSRRATLRCWPLPSPWHLISGLARLSSLTIKDRLNLIKVDRALRHAIKNPGSLSHVTVEEWLRSCGQSERARRHLWDLIAIATLNEDPSIACAEPFATVLALAFFDTREASRLGISSVGLSDLYAHAARGYIAQHGGNIMLKAPVARVDVDGKKAVAVVLRDGRRLAADWVISAVPPHAFIKLLPESIAQQPAYKAIEGLTYAPIISINLWFDRTISRDALAGLLDTQIQWFFNKVQILKNVRTSDGYVALVISGAHAFVSWNEKKIVTLALEELRRIYPTARDAVLLRSLVIKEHHATLSPTIGSDALRPNYRTPVDNLFVAGDWTNTGLPATIESACVSGHACADIVKEAVRV